MGRYITEDHLSVAGANDRDAASTCLERAWMIGATSLGTWFSARVFFLLPMMILVLVTIVQPRQGQITRALSRSRLTTQTTDFDFAFAFTEFATIGQIRVYDYTSSRARKAPLRSTQTTSNSAQLPELVLSGLKKNLHVLPHIPLPISKYLAACEGSTEASKILRMILRFSNLHFSRPRQANYSWLKGAVSEWTVLKHIQTMRCKQASYVECLGSERPRYEDSLGPICALPSQVLSCDQ